MGQSITRVNDRESVPGPIGHGVAERPMIGVGKPYGGSDVVPTSEPVHSPHRKKETDIPLPSPTSPGAGFGGRLKQGWQTTIGVFRRKSGDQSPTNETGGGGGGSPSNKQQQSRQHGQGQQGGGTIIEETIITSKPSRSGTTPPSSPPQMGGRSMSAPGGPSGLSGGGGGGGGHINGEHQQPIWVEESGLIATSEADEWGNETTMISTSVEQLPPSSSSAPSSPVTSPSTLKQRSLSQGGSPISSPSQQQQQQQQQQRQRSPSGSNDDRMRLNQQKGESYGTMNEQQSGQINTRKYTKSEPRNPPMSTTTKKSSHNNKSGNNDTSGSPYNNPKFNAAHPVIPIPGSNQYYDMMPVPPKWSPMNTQPDELHREASLPHHYYKGAPNATATGTGTGTGTGNGNKNSSPLLAYRSGISPAMQSLLPPKYSPMNIQPDELHRERTLPHHEEIHNPSNYGPYSGGASGTSAGGGGVRGGGSSPPIGGYKIGGSGGGPPPISLNEHHWPPGSSHHGHDHHIDSGGWPVFPFVAR